jgi:hypothetical protein
MLAATVKKIKRMVPVMMNQMLIVETPQYQMDGTTI